MFSDKAVLDSANLIGVDAAEILTVAEVESNNSGFLHTGEPVILYEPFKFGTYTNHKYDGTTVSIGSATYPLSLSGKWSVFRAKYGIASIQHKKLHAASHYDRNAALEACSWGRFQILGRNWKDLGYQSLQEFINCMYRSEDDHLEAFTRYIRHNNLVHSLKTHNWSVFAAGFNGSNYKDNCYDGKLAKAWAKYGRN